MSAFRVNLLCVIGASLGVASMFTPWLIYHEFGYRSDAQEYSVDLMFYNYLFAVPILIFLSGTILAFLTPAGGVVQLTGLGAFFYSWSVVDDQVTRIDAGIGLVLAIVSGILVVAGFRYSLWFTYSGQGSRRLITFSQPSGDEPRHRPHKSRSWSRIRHPLAAGRPLTRVNIMCLAGAFLGVSSIAFAWTQATWPFIPAAELGNSLLGVPTWSYIPDDIAIPAAAILIGSVLAFISPLGGVLQLVGTLTFLLVVKDSLGIHTGASSSYQYTASLGAGFYLSILALCLVLGSMVLQRFIGVRLRSLSTSTWLWTWESGSVADAKAEAPSTQGFSLNALGIIGAFIGIVSLFGSWTLIGPYMYRDDLMTYTMCPRVVPTFGYSSIVGNLVMVGEPLVMLGTVLFLGGTALAFGSQLGGGLQMVGVVSFLAGVLERLDYGNGYSYALGVGFFLALASGMIVLASVVWPVRFVTKFGRVEWLGRMLVPGFHDAETTRAKPGAGHGCYLVALLPRWGKKLRINVLCLAGAVLGVFAISLAWASEGYPGVLIDAYLESFLVSYILQGPFGTMVLSLPIVIAIVFVLGTIISFFSPAGGFLQLIGVMLFAYEFNDIYPTVPQALQWQWVLAPGFFIGLVASLVVLSSLVCPLGIGIKGWRQKTTHRMLVWGVRLIPTKPNDSATGMASVTAKSR